MPTALAIADKAAYPTGGDTGPTYREWVAAQIAAGMAARPFDPEVFADRAVQLADALIARLAQS